MKPTYFANNISDYVGKTFGCLTVVGKSRTTSKFSNTWDFRCICGRVISEPPARVLSGHKKRCGFCNASKRNLVPRFDVNSYIGKRSHMLTVVGLSPRRENDRAWKLLCKCDCGNETRITPHQFDAGKVMSCGCLRKSSKNEFDGHSKHPIYKIWSQMMRRCYNLKAKHYDRYGGRGISVCEDWHSFNNFAAWSDSVGGRPYGTSLDRIDNDGNYEPSNCRWADLKTQHRNTSANIVIEYNGEKKTLVEWSEATGISWPALNNRYHRGWSVERMLTEPVHKKAVPEKG